MKDLFQVVAHGVADGEGDTFTVALTSGATCPECGRVFDLFIEAEADEWFAGHDCEPGLY